MIPKTVMDNLYQYVTQVVQPDGSFFAIDVFSLALTTKDESTRSCLRNVPINHILKRLSYVDYQFRWISFGIADYTWRLRIA